MSYYSSGIMVIVYVLLSILLVVSVVLFILNRQLKKRIIRRDDGVDSNIYFSEVLLKNVKAYLLLVSSDFYVLKTNYYQATGIPESKHPKRVGELLRCMNALNSAGCGLHEYCAECPVRQAISRAFHTHSDFSDVESSMQIELSEGNAPVNCEVTVSGSFLLLGGKECLLLTVHDITKLKEIQKELLSAKEMAESSDRLKTAFLANMSHEIRTPLNAIVGFSELLDTDNEDERKLYLEIIRKNNNQLLQLINDIIDLAKIEAGVLDFTCTETDLNALIVNLAEMFRLRNGEQSAVQIQSHIPDRVYTLVTDRKRVTQVLSNFMTNALKFTSEGCISIGYECVEDREYRFFVSDTGAGIAKEQQENIFDRFVQLDPNKPGTGLGLSICRMIVGRLNGRIGVDSVPDEGSVFWFTLPVDAVSFRP